MRVTLPWRPLAVLPVAAFMSAPAAGMPEKLIPKPGDKQRRLGTRDTVADFVVQAVMKAGA